MDIVIRPIVEQENDTWLRRAEAVFGLPHPTAEVLAMERSVHEFDRAFGAFDDDAMVGTTGSYGFSIIVPGGADVAVAAVSMVTVAPTHRRRGILTELMRHQLDDIAARGEPLAALNASEALIYDRFGFGPAVDAVGFEIDTRTADFRRPLEDHGSVVVIDRDDAHDEVAAIYERFRSTRNGSIGRSSAWWKVLLGPIENWRGGGEINVVVHRSPEGEPDGYAFYVLHGRIEHGLQVGTTEVRDVVGVTAEVEAALWRFLLDIDLATRAIAVGRPVDDPIRWRLLEPRQLRTVERADLLWLRLVDVGRALALRSYAGDDRLVLYVTDRFLPANEGCYLVGGATDESGVVTDASPHLTVDVSSLGAAYLGGVSFATLAAAGRVVQHEPDAIRRADALFVTPRAPHCTTKF